MNRFLIKTIETYRVETIEDVERFHDYLQQDAETNGYFLSNFKYDYKTQKASGEVIAEWYLVTATKSFQDAKEPYRVFDGIEYKTKGSLELEAQDEEVF